MKSRDVERTVATQQRFLARFQSFTFDDAAARVYGQIRAHLEREGTPIGANDLLIAAIAVVNGFTLVTANTGEYGRVAGLALENWEAQP